MSCMLLIQGWTKYIPLYILLYRPIPTYTDNSYGEEHFNSRSNGVHPGHTHTHSWSAAARQQDSLQHYIRYNYTRPGEDRQPIRFQLACQPKTNCVLALTEVFYLHNSNPKAKQPAPGYITDLFTSTKHTTPQPHWNRHMLDPYTCTRHNFTHKSTRNGIHTQQCDRPRACCKQLQWHCVGDIKNTALITHHQTP